MSNLEATHTFVSVARVEDVPPGTVKEVQLEGRMLALANVGGELFALDNRCPHKGGPLGKGKLIGDVVMCPWHTIKFNVRTGVCTINPKRVAERFPVQVRDGEIFVSPEPIADPS